MKNKIALENENRLSIKYFRRSKVFRLIASVFTCGNVPIYSARAIYVYFILFYFILFYHSGCLKSDKSFEQYKTEIIELGKAKQFDKALSLLDEVKLKFPNEKKFQAGIYYHLAHGYYAEGKYREAKSILEKATREYSNDNKLFALYARVLIKTSEQKKAFPALERYPKDLEMFNSELKKTQIDIWTAYDLAASYALLGNKDLAFKYLEVAIFIFVNQWDPKMTLENIEKEADFDELRNDQRYTFLKELVVAEPFDIALEKFETEQKKTQSVVAQFSAKKIEHRKALENLREILRNVSSVHTVAPVLIKIQKELIAYIDNVVAMVSGGQHSSSEVLEEKYDKIAAAIDDAKASQSKRT